MTSSALRERGHLAAQQVHLRERVTVAGEEENRQPMRRPVRGPQLVGMPRSVQRIAEEDERAHGLVRGEHAGHAPTV